MVDWIGQVYLQRGPTATVHDVVQAAGVGRNTFYEYFDGLDHALDYAAQTHAKQMHERLAEALENARTPIAKLRELSRAWFDELASEPAQAALLLRLPPGGGSAAASVFKSLLATALKEGRTYGAAASEQALIDYAAFAAEGGARSLLSSGSQKTELQEGLSTLLTRVFR